MIAFGNIPVDQVAVLRAYLDAVGSMLPEPTTLSLPPHSSIYSATEAIAPSVTPREAPAFSPAVAVAHTPEAMFALRRAVKAFFSNDGVHELALLTSPTSERPLGHVPTTSLPPTMTLITDEEPHAAATEAANTLEAPTATSHKRSEPQDGDQRPDASTGSKRRKTQNHSQLQEEDSSPFPRPAEVDDLLSALLDGCIGGDADGDANGDANVATNDRANERSHPTKSAAAQRLKKNRDAHRTIDTCMLGRKPATGRNPSCLSQIALNEDGSAPPPPRLAGSLTEPPPAVGPIQDPALRTLENTEAAQDTSDILTELALIHEGASCFYPPLSGSGQLLGRTTRALEEEFRHFSWKFPADFAVADYHSKRFSARMGIAPFRCTTLACRLEPQYLTPADGTPYRGHDREEIFIGSVGRSPIAKRATHSTLVHEWMERVLPVVFALIDPTWNIRNLDIWDIIAYVGSRRFGWVWHADMFRLIASDKYKTNDWAHKEVIAMLLDLNKGNLHVRPTYDIDRRNILYEDLTIPLSGQCMTPRAPLLRAFSSASLLDASKPSYVGEAILRSKTAEQDLPSIFLDDFIEQLLSFYKPDLDSLPRRRLWLHADSTALSTDITQEDIELAISKSLFGVLFRVRDVHFSETGRRLAIDFFDEIHLCAAVAVMSVWLPQLYLRSGVRLRLPTNFSFPKPLRTVSLVPRPSADTGLNAGGLADQLEHLGYSGSTVQLHLEGRKKRGDLLVTLKTWTDTLGLLNEHRLDPSSRFILAWHVPHLTWCPDCGRPGHKTCSLRETVCDLCPKLDDALAPHQRIHTVRDALQQEPIACAAHRCLQFYNDRLWNLAVRQGVAGDGLYSMSEAGISFRFDHLRANEDQAFGLRCPLPPPIPNSQD